MTFRLLTLKYFFSGNKQIRWKMMICWVYIVTCMSAINFHLLVLRDGGADFLHCWFIDATYVS